jgi:hypothetical protein
MTPDKEFAIPLLPCNSINNTLEFYQALGFRVTYQQKAPNTYAALKLRDIEVHFFVMKDLKPENNYSTCYIVLYDIDTLYQSFAAGMKNLFGKIPVKGIPRINPLKDMPSYGVRQFIVVDPAGNYIRIGQPIPKTDSLIFKENNLKKETAGSSLEKAYELGSRLADAKGDFPAAAKALDKAIAHADNGEPVHLFRVLILRADVAFRMEDHALTNKLLEKAKALISDIDQRTVKDDLRLMEELRLLLNDK